jgi:hypothetical protein
MIDGWGEVNEAIKKFSERFGHNPKYLMSDYALFSNTDCYNGIEIIRQYVGYRVMFLSDDRLPSGCWSGDSSEISTSRINRK